MGRTIKTYDRANRTTGETNASATSFGYDVAGNVVQTQHDGLQTDMTYDVLGRLTRRTAQYVAYSNMAGNFHTLLDNRFAQPRFPEYYWFSPIGVPEEIRYNVPADTAVFAYDSLGNMLEARNGDAWVFRAYRANGTVASDTLLIRTVATIDSGGSFRQHVYPLSYTYDIMGRRTQRSGVGPTVTSQYDSLGRLKSVQSSSGNTFRFVYTRNGELDSLVYPNQVFQSNVYDDDGRLTLRKEWRTTTTFHADTMTYDSRGKLLTSRGVGVEAGNAYDGFGALARSTRRSTPNGWDTSDESFWVDALGYQRSRSAGPLRSDTIVYRYTASNAQHAATNFPNGTGTSEGTLTADTTYFDDAGGRNIYLSQTGSTSSYSIESGAYFYDGNGRLRIADVRRCSNTSGYTCSAGQVQGFSGAFEEYRYDALGRRVWVRARKDNRCSANQDDCTSTLTRTVWDGDQVVAEYRTLGGNGSGVPVETDGGSLTKTGTITYVHGPGIDRPLEVSRNSAVVIPYYNWRSLADQGSYGTCHDFEHTGGGPFYCGSVEWPAARLEIYSNLRAGKARTVGTYWGSLLQESQDASGLLYRRNRYYDGTSGKFTQEDPIGIEGGLNIYGYASGDPVSYSDPFGLDPCQASKAWTECLAQALANWGAQRGGAVGNIALNAAAAANATLEAYGINAAAAAGDDIGSGNFGRGTIGIALALGPTKLAQGLLGASAGLRSLFAEGGGLANGTLIGIRASLKEAGFTMKLAENKMGYLFTNVAGEEVRLMRGANGWYLRARNAAGNYLDVLGNPGNRASTHITVQSR